MTCGDCVYFDRDSKECLANGWEDCAEWEQCGCDEWRRHLLLKELEIPDSAMDEVMALVVSKRKVVV